MIFWDSFLLLQLPLSDGVQLMNIFFLELKENGKKGKTLLDLLFFERKRQVLEYVGGKSDLIWTLWTIFHTHTIIL